MKAAALLLIVAMALMIAALNAAVCLDAMASLYAYPPAREAIAWTWGLIGFCLGAMALALLSRRAYRQLDQDFPEHGIGATDLETAHRTNDRH